MTRQAAGNRRREVARGVAALALLLAGTVGAPLLLLRLTRGLLAGWPASDLMDLLTRPDDGRLLVAAVLLIAWAAWLVLAATVTVEAITLAARRRIRLTLPGLGGPQRWAGSMLLAIAALVPSAPSTTAAPPPAPHSRPLHDPPASAQAAVRPASAVATATRPSHVHVVVRGDDLWSLAERYYGHGREWRRIAQANAHLLSGGPDRLQVGWQLRIPDDGPRDAVAEARSVTVQPGDTLSSIAARRLGAAERWPEIYRMNRAQLADPDLLPVGLELALPAPQDRTAELSGRHAAEPVLNAEPTGAEQSAAAPVEVPEEVPASAPEPQPDQLPSATPTPETGGTRAEPDRPGTTTATPFTDAVAPGLAAVGGLLAAGLLGGLASRRRLQLQARPPGRRIPHAPEAAQLVEAQLGRQQRPLGLRALDRAMRAVAAHCRLTGEPTPVLELALLSASEIEFRVRQPAPPPPVGFACRDGAWVLAASDVDYLRTAPGLSEAPRPWPALVTLGRDDRDRLVLGNLEALRLLGVSAGPGVDPSGTLAAMAVELSFSPWADEMVLTLVGGDSRLPEALGKHNVARTDDLDQLLDHLEARAREQRGHGAEDLGRHRIDPDLTDPWAPEVVLVDGPVTDAQYSRLAAVIEAEPAVTLAAVLADPPGSPGWALRGDRAGGGAVLDPVGLPISVQHLAVPEQAAVLDLIETTGRPDTSPAHWWVDPGSRTDPPPDDAELAQLLESWGLTEGEGGMMQRTDSRPGGPMRHPMLQLLGPIELLDAAGTPPPRAAKQCLEYCAWLLEHPGTSAQAMGAALAVAEGTRRSNMSRLRSWLGTAPGGAPYLPDAYTGRIALLPTVSSDWQRVQILTATGVNRAGDASLRAALDLVRGAPLADAAPGQWHWAEELRTDMISCVRDIGVELTHRALEAGDLELARRAASRALLAAPGDERLVAARIRTEHRAGNTAETERLTLQLAAQARALGSDLDPETVALLQEVMEGRVRARLA